MVFQEMVEGARKETFNINQHRKNEKAINWYRWEWSLKMALCKSQNKSCTIFKQFPKEETYQSTKEQLLNLRKFMRYSSTNQDEIPRFIGLIALLYSQKRLPISLKYLPPLQNPITEIYAMTKIFEISQNLSKQANMKYMHIILDLGAAIKAFHVIWNQNEHWKNIIISSFTIIHLWHFPEALASMSLVAVSRKLYFSRDCVLLAQLLVCYQKSITVVIFEFIIEFWIRIYFIF